MILEASREQALQEMLVIAAGLSIQDPRERPADRKEAAQAAHQRFQHPESDFLALWNIWNAYHDTWETLRTQSQLRKFCRAHFLSFIRMREWVDIYHQLEDALEALDLPNTQAAPASYAAIHRSILVGLLGHVATRTEQRSYRTAGGREAFLFPGSGLSGRDEGERKTPRPATGSSRPARPAPASPPPWIVAGEVMETSRVFLRTAARIDPEWVVELAPHLVRRTYDLVRWDREQGRVLARERAMLRGLVLQENTVGYVRINPAEATELFIQRALIERDLETAERYPFLAHNDRLRQKVEVWQTRMPQRAVPDLDEAFRAFYAARLVEVGSLHDLNRVLKKANDPACLCAHPPDLLGPAAARFEHAGLPDQLEFGDHTVPVDYAYAPGADTDGVTVRLTVPLAQAVDPDVLDWAVPALREDRVLQLLRQLPKTIRRPLMPLDALARQIVASIPAGTPGYLDAAREFIREHRGVTIPPESWRLEDLPSHLRLRVEVVDADARVVAAGRDMGTIRRQLRDQGKLAATGLWETAVRAWERYDLERWEFGDLPAVIELGSVAGFNAAGYPGLVVEGQAVHLRLFHEPDEAETATRAGWPALAKRELSRELAWLEKDLRGLDRCRELYVSLGPADELRETAWINLVEYLFPAPPAGAVLRRDAFDAYLAESRARFPGLAAEMCQRVTAILQERQRVLTLRTQPPFLRPELQALVPPRFLERTPFPRLVHLPRYVKALGIRAERAALSPAKDAEKLKRVEPYTRAWADLRAAARPHAAAATAALDRFRWLVEEYRVSCFAQELGTAEPVSPRRLDDALESLQNLRRNSDKT